MNHTPKRLLTVGMLSATLVLGIGAGLSAQDDDSVESVSGDAAVSGLYWLSPPNEQDTGGSVRSVPVTSAPYRLSAPNELNPQALPVGDSAATQPYPYRLSPPNETDPTGP
jgi:hypothetical protein